MLAKIWRRIFSGPNVSTYKRWCVGHSADDLAQKRGVHPRHVPHGPIHRGCEHTPTRKNTQKRVDSRAWFEDTFDTAVQAALDGDCSYLPVMGLNFTKPMTTKTTKLTIEVDPEQQAKLHETCPELFTAPSPQRYDWENWYCPSDAECRVRGQSQSQIKFQGLYIYDIEDIRHLSTHLLNILKDHDQNN